MIRKIHKIMIPFHILLSQSQLCFHITTKRNHNISLSMNIAYFGKFDKFKAFIISCKINSNFIKHPLLWVHHASITIIT